MKNNRTRQLVLAGLFLALLIVLPLVTMQVPTLSILITPMHFPVILAAVFLGPVYGAIVGFSAPLLRTFMFSMPPMPIALMMAFELLAYGLFMGLFLKLLKGRSINFALKVLIALIISMILGRIVYALVMTIFLNASFTGVFIATFTESFLGIILQLIFIPILAGRLKKYAFTN